MKSRRIEAMPGVALAWSAIAADPSSPALTEHERAIFATLVAEKRRAEWCAGRLCARAALAELGVTGVSIVADPRGVPLVEGADAQVSIAHGRRMAAAVAGCGVYAGVDIVDLEDDDRIQKLSKRVLTDHERKLQESEPKTALLAWGTREAIAKATQTGMFMYALAKAPIHSIDRATRRVLTELEGIEVIFEDLEDGGVLVLATASPAARESARDQAGLPR